MCWCGSLNFGMLLRNRSTVLVEQNHDRVDDPQEDKAQFVLLKHSQAPFYSSFSEYTHLFLSLNFALFILILSHSIFGSQFATEEGEPFRQKFGH